MKEDALKFFKEGYSCSESVLKAAIESKLIPEHFLPAGTAFSGGISSGCLCGAIAGCEIIIGAIKGRNDSSQSPVEAKSLAKEFITRFKDKYKATCCRVLSGKYEFSSPERKAHCAEMVGGAMEILEDILKIEKTKAASQI